ncbi:RRQRL motif-containing zinc-binding protein [Kribbella sp. NPDC051770]|uniref:RRQRL motif-containing zinc-binding protein n=1 Tax=Kribbella sp. NPDC051770 TaxID=3155413 RepID=UPI00343D16C2
MAAPLMDRASLHPAASRWIELWNGKQALGWDHHGTPVFKFRWAPAGLATRRQLRALRMCPGGQPPYAVLVWRNGKAWAWLYRLDLARPSRVASPAQLNALDKAMQARRTCGQCGRIADYCIPTSDGRCDQCMTSDRYATAAA